MLGTTLGLRGLASAASLPPSPRYAPLALTRLVRSAPPRLRPRSALMSSTPHQKKPRPRSSSSSPSSAFWKWTTQPRPLWKKNAKEGAVAVAVFGVTGTASVAVVRPMFSMITGIEGTLREGPWSYRVGSVLCLSPVYAAMLMAIGTASGRHPFFCRMGTKLLGRFLPGKNALDPITCAAGLRAKAAEAAAALRGASEAGATGRAAS